MGFFKIFTEVVKPVKGYDKKNGKKDGRAHYSGNQAAAINEGRVGRPKKSNSKN